MPHYTRGEQIGLIVSVIILGLGIGLYIGGGNPATTRSPSASP